MKVLFAINDENIVSEITSRYQQKYKEIITSKSVYYFNAILNELQNEKDYDAIVIGEDLEPIADNNYDRIDRFILEKMDEVSDEASQQSGQDIPIILICSDRRTRNDPVLAKLFSMSIYNAITGNDRTVDNVCELIARPRGKKEAKSYYNMNRTEEYDPITGRDVSESEIQSILNHYTKIAGNPQKCVESFNSIASQYNQKQLQIIVNFLPLSVKNTLGRYSQKYQQLFATSNNKNIQNNKKEGADILTVDINKGQKLDQPVVIPTTISKPVTEYNNNNSQYLNNSGINNQYGYMNNPYQNPYMNQQQYGNPNMQYMQNNGYNQQQNNGQQINQNMGQNMNPHMNQNMNRNMQRPIQNYNQNNLGYNINQQYNQNNGQYYGDNAQYQQNDMQRQMNFSENNNQNYQYQQTINNNQIQKNSNSLSQYQNNGQYIPNDQYNKYNQQINQNVQSQIQNNEYNQQNNTINNIHDDKINLNTTKFQEENQKKNIVDNFNDEETKKYDDIASVFEKPIIPDPEPIPEQEPIKFEEDFNLDTEKKIQKSDFDSKNFDSKKDEKDDEIKEKQTEESIDNNEKIEETQDYDILKNKSKTTEQEEKSVKRGRGRPRKIYSEEEENKTKRGRGRPRKAPVVDEKQTQIQEKENQENRFEIAETNFDNDDFFGKIRIQNIEKPILNEEKVNNIKEEKDEEIEKKLPIEENEKELYPELKIEPHIIHQSAQIQVKQPLNQENKIDIKKQNIIKQDNSNIINSEIQQNKEIENSKDDDYVLPSPFGEVITKDDGKKSSPVFDTSIFNNQYETHNINEKTTLTTFDNDSIIDSFFGEEVAPVASNYLDKEDDNVKTKQQETNIIINNDKHSEIPEIKVPNIKSPFEMKNNPIDKIQIKDDIKNQEPISITDILGNIVNPSIKQETDGGFNPYTIPEPFNQNIDDDKKFENNNEELKNDNQTYEELVNNQDQLEQENYIEPINQFKNLNYIEPVNQFQQTDYIEPTNQFEMQPLYAEHFEKEEPTTLLNKGAGKLCTFIGTSKNGVSFIVNNLAQMLIQSNARVAIIDETKNRNSFYIYTNNDEPLINDAVESIKNLERGVAKGLEVSRYLTIYTNIPDGGLESKNENIEAIVSTLTHNYDIILVDSDFETNKKFFEYANEIYIVQSMDALTIQPITKFLSELKDEGILEEEKLRIIINKYMNMKRLPVDVVIEGLTRYNEPTMTLQKELFNSKHVPAILIPFDMQAYTRYMDVIATCQMTLNGYPTVFLNSLDKLASIIYGTAPELNINKKKRAFFSGKIGGGKRVKENKPQQEIQYKSNVQEAENYNYYNDQYNTFNNQQDPFASNTNMYSTEMNETLNKMKKNNF